MSSITETGHTRSGLVYTAIDHILTGTSLMTLQCNHGSERLAPSAGHEPPIGAREEGRFRQPRCSGHPFCSPFKIGMTISGKYRRCALHHISARALKASLSGTQSASLHFATRCGLRPRGLELIALSLSVAQHLSAVTCLRFFAQSMGEIVKPTR